MAVESLVAALLIFGAAIWFLIPKGGMGSTYVPEPEWRAPFGFTLFVTAIALMAALFVHEALA